MLIIYIFLTFLIDGNFNCFAMHDSLHIEEKVLINRAINYSLGPPVEFHWTEEAVGIPSPSASRKHRSFQEQCKRDKLER